MICFYFFRIKSTLTGTIRVFPTTNEHTDPTTFMITYFPRPDDAGIFTVVRRLNDCYICFYVNYFIYDRLEAYC